jgi:hypothetical protein
MHEAYQPVIDDGRGRFPEDLRVKAPRGARAAACTAENAWKHGRYSTEITETRRYVRALARLALKTICDGKRA